MKRNAESRPPGSPRKTRPLAPAPSSGNGSEVQEARHVAQFERRGRGEAWEESARCPAPASSARCPPGPAPLFTAPGTPYRSRLIVSRRAPCRALPPPPAARPASPCVLPGPPAPPMDSPTALAAALDAASRQPPAEGLRAALPPPAALALLRRATKALAKEPTLLQVPRLGGALGTALQPGLKQALA